MSSLFSAPLVLASLFALVVAVALAALALLVWRLPAMAASYVRDSLIEDEEVLRVISQVGLPFVLMPEYLVLTNMRLIFYRFTSVRGTAEPETMNWLQRPEIQIREGIWRSTLVARQRRRWKPEVIERIRTKDARVAGRIAEEIHYLLLRANSDPPLSLQQAGRSISAYFSDSAPTAQLLVPVEGVARPGPYAAPGEGRGHASRAAGPRPLTSAEVAAHFRKEQIAPVAASALALLVAGALTVGALMVRESPSGASATEPGALESLAKALATAAPALPVAQTAVPEPAAATPEIVPAFTLVPFESAWESETECITCLVPDWEEPAQPGEYSWNVTYPAGQPAVARWGWCAIDGATLEANWAQLDYRLSIDGQAVDLASLALQEQQFEDRVCRYYSGRLSGWQPGPHLYTWSYTIRDGLHDGWAAYAPGDYVLEFRVEVADP